jgi:hypothetical protein
MLILIFSGCGLGQAMDQYNNYRCRTIAIQHQMPAEDIVRICK